MKIACVGEAMVELALAPDGNQAKVGFAGDTLNSAIYLKRQAPILSVDYVTRVGRDDFSTGLLEFIQGEAVGTGSVGVSETRNLGLYAISTDGQGERSFSYWRGQSAAREMFDSGYESLQGFDLVYLSAITLAILPDSARLGLYKYLTQFRAKDGQVAFDSNYRPALWTDRATAQAEIQKMWELTDIALPSADDEAAIYGDNSVDETVARLQSWGVTQGALKNGPNGPISLSAPVSEAFAEATDIVDTTAAGDSFNAGYLGTFLQGNSQVEALHQGHNLASRVIGVRGAIIPKA